VDHALFPHTHLIRLIFGSFESVELKLEILYGIKGLESVQDAWRDLTCSVSALSLGQIVDYYLAYAFAFEVQDRDLLIATVKDADERIIAIVPLCQSKKKLLGLEINYLQFPDIPVPIRDVVIDPSGSADEILNFLFWSLDKAIDSHGTIFIFGKFSPEAHFFHTKARRWRTEGSFTGLDIAICWMFPDRTIWQTYSVRMRVTIYGATRRRWESLVLSNFGQFRSFRTWKLHTSTF
jgi:hypothetical protein